MDRQPQHERNNFDALRILLAASVVVFHTAFLSNVPQFAWLTSDAISTIGVQGFFFVSGFLVVMSYERSSSAMAYAAKRTRRIAPAYVATVVGFALVLAAMSSLPAIEYFSDPGLYKYLFYNLMLSNFAEPTLPGVFTSNFRHAVNGSLWTIKIEVLFYLMVPVICWATAKLPKLPFLVALALTSLAWNVGLRYLGTSTGNPFLVRLSLQAPGQLSYFIAGTIAYYRMNSGLPAAKGWQAIVALLLYLFTSGSVNDLLGPVAIYFMMSWAALRAPIPGNWTRHGDVSYGIYLLHWPVVQILVACGAFAANPYAGSLACWCIVTALAYASWHLVERRFLVGHSKARAIGPILLTT